MREMGVVIDRKNVNEVVGKLNHLAGITKCEEYEEKAYISFVWLNEETANKAADVMVKYDIKSNKKE